MIEKMPTIMLASIISKCGSGYEGFLVFMGLYGIVWDCSRMEL